MSADEMRNEYKALKGRIRAIEDTRCACGHPFSLHSEVRCHSSFTPAFVENHVSGMCDCPAFTATSDRGYSPELSPSGRGVILLHRKTR